MAASVTELLCDLEQIVVKLSKRLKECVLCNRFVSFKSLNLVSLLA